jgi:hypothetical protein
MINTTPDFWEGGAVMGQGIRYLEFVSLLISVSLQVGQRRSIPSPILMYRLRLSHRPWHQRRWPTVAPSVMTRDPRLSQTGGSFNYVRFSCRDFRTANGSTTWADRGSFNDARGPTAFSKPARPSQRLMSPSGLSAPPPPPTGSTTRARSWVTARSS